jgi:GntR family transcriptional regulator/MocR family aminotransferase
VAEAGVAVRSLAAYAHGGAAGGPAGEGQVAEGPVREGPEAGKEVRLVLGYAHLTPGRIRAGVERMAAAV